jgi:hypothetical protein
MKKHIDLVGLLYILAAVVSGLAAAAVFILGLGAMSIAWWDGPRMAATLTAATFIVVAGLLVLWAGANAWVGRELRRRRRPLARLAAFALAIVHLFVLPFGTALGVYGLWVLLHPETRAEFEGQQAAEKRSLNRESRSENLE